MHVLPMVFSAYNETNISESDKMYLKLICLLQDLDLGILKLASFSFDMRRIFDKYCNNLNVQRFFDKCYNDNSC